MVKVRWVGGKRKGRVFPRIWPIAAVISTEDAHIPSEIFFHNKKSFR